MRLQVNDFMTPMVLTADGTTTVGEIRNMMQRNGVHAIPIIKRMPNDSWSIKGIVTSTDLCKKMDENQPIQEVMNECRVHVIAVNTSVQAAAKMMLKHKVHHLVVMDDGHIIGMISSQDFVKLVADYVLEPRYISET